MSRPPRILVALLAFAMLLSAARAEEKPGERLREVIGTYWSDLLKTHPIEATLYVGDHKYDDRLNDPTLETYYGWLNRLKKTRADLEAIDSKTLSADERIDREILMGMIDDRVALKPFGDQFIPLVQIVRASTDVRSDDLHLVFTQLGEFHPANTAGDVENFTRRLRAFPKLVDGLIGVLQRGIDERHTPPRLVAARVLTQLQSLSVPDVSEHPLWAYTKRLPDDWPEAKRIAAVDNVRDALKDDVIPAYKRLAGFFAKTYLPACRESIGLASTANGTVHYALLVRHYTTTDFTAEQIHRMGLDEVAKTRAELEEIRRQVGFEGDLKAFFAQIRSDPKFKNKTEAQILEGHRKIVAVMGENLPKLFGHLPVTPVEVRAFDPIRAKSAPTGEYLPAPSDGSRPGIFFVNTLDPTSRPTYTMQALAYHEALPGHHLQISLSQERPGRPAFRRYFYLPAFDEGWALYAEGLPDEIGLYTDPYAKFGRLTYNAHRSVRLVVDTGIHAQGWSRDRALAYFEENTALPRPEIENEIDRYIAWPGQALAYKIGELTLRELRREVKTREGKEFDLRAFHDRLLVRGSIPLRTLQRLWKKPQP